MHALTLYKEASAKYAEARTVADMIGMQERSTVGGKGRLHGVEVNAVIHYQPTDGAKNYHDSQALNTALGTVARKHWDMLLAEALAILKNQVEERKAAAAAEYQAEFEAA